MVWTYPPPQAASTVYYTFGDDEEVHAAGVRPAPLSEVVGPQERVQRHTVEQIEEFMPMVQILDTHVPRARGGSLESVLRWWLCWSRLSRSAGLLDPTNAVLEFVEARSLESVLKTFDESIDRLEHSSFRPRRLCRHYMAGRCEEGWSCTFAHGEQELHRSTLRGADRGRASAADHS